MDKKHRKEKLLKGYSLVNKKGDKIGVFTGKKLGPWLSVNGKRKFLVHEGVIDTNNIKVYEGGER